MDYDNLFLSCHAARRRRDRKSGTCGCRKAGRFDEGCHVAPVPEKACQQRFGFGGDGRVRGNGTDADNMIEALNLNASGLVHDRRNLIEALEELMGEGESAGLDETMVRDLISDCAAIKPDGTRDSYTHVGVRYLDQYLQ